ncbi:amidase [Pontivivens insulae]|uniref:Amidase AmiD n=1 Tax=Pontivivens insulae TaxID=1639689 RepID=A0A2R8AEE9_9RHOB|nr:amidase family protein [Pontivivens insulae]RED11819.1 aspartyl-tRNA(Asn)/glutamyl-tRNA(Gln) amidotransferase subunit A [Pontivivens insulae]SPF30576.1 Putative amidase AmiD [Pontivivens insulae]
MTDHLNWTAADQGRAIAAGTLDPVEMTEAYLDAISNHPAGQSIYARTTAERARAEAMAAAKRAKAGTRKGPLDGVSISWKDLFDTAGTETEAGSALLKGRLPDADAKVLATAAAHGTVCLGKTHMTELAFAGIGYNPVTATPPNIHDPDAVPGGSSSGAAASVAHGLAAVGIGSDTGGSVRVPSAWNDLVGLKTTATLLPLDGVVPLCAFFDTVGPLTRSVEDAALMLEALGGPKAPDLAGTHPTLNLAVLDTVAVEDARDAPRAAFETAVDALAKAGAQITRITSETVAEAMANGGPLFIAEAWATHGERIAAHPDTMFSEVEARFRAGEAVAAWDYIGKRKRLEELRAIWREEVSAFDAVLIPSAAITPPKVADLAADLDFYRAENLLALQNTRIGNLLGLSAITLPTGTPSCGIMAMGAAFGEAKLLRVASEMERMLGVR